MKFTSVKLIGAVTTLDLKVSGASLTDPYILKNIDGLGPVERDVFLSPNADGGDTYEGRRAHGRELVFLLKLNPNYGAGETVEGLRRNLNLMFARVLIPIQFVDDGVVVGKVQGVLKKMEIAPFTKEPQAQLTFVCEEPYIVGDAAFLTVGPSTPKTDYAVPYVGDAPAPFTIRLNVLATCASVSLKGPYPPKEIYAYGPTFQAGDEITFSTVPGWRVASYRRGGTDYSLLNGLVLGPPDDRTWPMMLPAADNKFTITTSAGPSAIEWESISYANYYEGI